jgi:hypothetical protein
MVFELSVEAIDRDQSYKAYRRPEQYALRTRYQIVIIK